MNPGFDKFNLVGKTALVTGGATGIGYEMARALAQSGATVLLAARRRSVLEEAAGKLNRDAGTSGRVLFHELDLLDRSSIKALSDWVTNEFGGVDIFIGNAGLEAPEPIDALTPGAIDDQIQVHLIGNMELTRNFLPAMKQRGWGRFIYSSSVAANFGLARDNVSVYSAAKAGLHAFARSVAAEGGRRGITANVLVLGNFLTAMARHHIESLSPADQQQYRHSLLSMMALGRSADPEEIGGVVQLLASDAGSYITGTCIPVDGGISIMLRGNPLDD